MKNKDKTTTLVITALMTALVLICTLLLRIPCGPDCYIHLGDTVIFLAVLILPRRYACFAGSVGAALADLMGGFAFWAPWTFFIKLIMVLVFGVYVDKSRKLDAAEVEMKTLAGIPNIELAGLVLACIVGVGGYFVSEIILFGQWIGALACVGFNSIQVAVDAVIAMLAYRKLNIEKM
ncbi:MAG: ECF transporter S component [Mogibacterium sp.]|nr:ECF transporter S component [Mogibacterium sp.]